MESGFEADRLGKAVHGFPSGRYFKKVDQCLLALSFPDVAGVSSKITIQQVIVVGRKKKAADASEKCIWFFPNWTRGVNQIVLWDGRQVA